MLAATALDDESGGAHICTQLIATRSRCFGGHHNRLALGIHVHGTGMATAHASWPAIAMRMQRMQIRACNAAART